MELVLLIVPEANVDLFNTGTAGYGTILELVAVEDICESSWMQP